MSESHRTVEVLAVVTSIPRDAEEPVFRAPWEAQAFGLAVSLHERGLFTWQEWTTAITAEIQAANQRGQRDDGPRYYEYWLTALEKIAVAKGVVSDAELLRHKDEWDRAAHTTPHGQPIVLPARR